MQAVRFSRYEIREELGQGGMATVYRAYDPLFEREVALKILKREMLNEPQVRERFERETKIIARLEHGAIVPVYDVGRDNDQLFFVMRYMTGGSLSERIQNRSLSLAEIAHVVQRVGAALDYAHEHGVVHRDVKPGNILFDENNNAYVSDFGIAKLAHAATKLTSSGIIGTPTHISPEQARGEEVDGRSDIYSLGVILFEMLSGKTPYDATTPLGMAFKHATDPIPRIREINPDLPASIQTVIDKVMAKNRELRYRTGAEFAEAFVATLSKPLPPTIDLFTPLPARLKTSIGAPTVPPLHPLEIAPRSGASARFWVFGGLVLLAVLGLFAWGYPRFVVPVIATPAPATATPAPATPTYPPTATPTQIPTATIAPTVTLSASIGGADKIALKVNNDIYVMDMDGSHLRQVTNTNRPKFDLQWLSGESELLYGEANCVYRINVDADEPAPEAIVCFKDPKFDGFRLSPDGKQVAVSIERRLLVLPFDTQALSKVSSAFELQNFEDLCLDYADIAVKGARWSADGQEMAILYQSVVNRRLGDTIRVLKVDLQRCREVDPLIMDEFPAKRFVPEGYERYPILPSFDWDGRQQFLFNTFQRNVAYGELYLYDRSKGAARMINPIDDVCCYSAATFSPNGSYILFVFQDVRRGADGENQLYYIPVDQIGTESVFRPIKLPIRFFPNLRENIQLALHPAP